MAPIGWPFDLRPPEGLTGKPAVLRRPAFADGASPLAWRGQAHRLIFDQFGDGEAVMRLDEGQVRKRRAGALMGFCQATCAAFESDDVARRHRQEILGMGGGAEVHGLWESARRSRCRT